MGPSTPVSIFAALQSDELNAEERSAIQKHSFLLAHLVIGTGFVVSTLFTLWLIQVTSGQPTHELRAQEEIHRKVLGYELTQRPIVSLDPDAMHTICVLVPQQLEGEGSIFHASFASQKIDAYGRCKAQILQDGQKHHFIKLGLVNWHYGHRASLLVDRGQRVHYLLQRSQGQWHVIERRIQFKRTS